MVSDSFDPAQGVDLAPHPELGSLGWQFTQSSYVTPGTVAVARIAPHLFHVTANEALSSEQQLSAVNEFLAKSSSGRLVAFAAGQPLL